MKLYKPGLLVTAEEVRALWGVLDRDRRASKAVMTTTSGFAPGVRKEFADSIPTRLDLRDGTALRDWLQATFKK
jgi:restriction system protein